MKELIAHLMRENMEGILDNSFMNCHAIGLHSIMFIKSPEQTIRLFIAENGNTLDMNGKMQYDKKQMSVGFHAHHCNITLHVIKGSLINWKVEEDNEGMYNALKFRYKSGILTNECAFEYMDNVGITHIEEKLIAEGEIMALSASEIHTVSTTNYNTTAWFVYEGKEDVNYIPVTYSNHRIDKEDYSNLYQPMIKEHLIKLLQLCELYDY